MEKSSKDDASQGERVYAKHFIPLESNPDLFTELIHKLGIASTVFFQDVLSLDDPDLLAFIPRPVLALVLVFPAHGDYETFLAERESQDKGRQLDVDCKDIIWFKQTIHNACGLYAILHAVCNGLMHDQISPNTTISKLISECTTEKSPQRCRILESNTELESAYNSVALRGDTAAPDNPEDEVDYHYVCFVKSQNTGHLLELDGDRAGPIDHGLLQGDDVLSSYGINTVKNFISIIEDKTKNANFNLLALVSE